MGLFGSKVDRSKALRTQRVSRLVGASPGHGLPPAELSARRLMGTIASLGALGAAAGSGLLVALVVALNHWQALSGLTGTLVLGAGSVLGAAFAVLAARAFAPVAVSSAREAARAGALVLLTVALARGAVLVGAPYLAPLPLAGAVAVVVYGPPFALALGAPLVLAAGISRALDDGVALAEAVEYATALGLGYALAVILCRRVTSRPALIRSGFVCGAAIAASLLAVRGVLASRAWTHFPPPGSYDLVWALLNGALFGFVLFELLPAIERLTGAITDIRLLELADLNRPILKKMNLEAPGTFHHSQVVSRLAEAAAEAIGANGLLARVGAYYHDLGKMAKPAYFTENNRESGKKHGVLRPTLSALVIHAHVKDGIELAHEIGLPEKVAAFIPEHHGTTACEFFYRQAAREAQERGTTVDKEVFRYPGPRPRSKETAIVHIADSVEAVTRSLAEPTPSRIENVVHEVVMDKLLDHQLDECPLTLGDLRLLQESMTRVLTGIYHGRVKYPQKLEATAWEQRLARLARQRREEHGEQSTPAPEATPKPAAGFEPPMTW
jgi:putative nucleotidyltransferase with HDIG domain